MFTEALFMMVKTWKQPKCPSTDNWLKKMCTHTHTHTHTHTMECYSAIKNKEMMLFEATRMQLEVIILSEVSQEEEKDKYHMISCICGI